MFILFRPSPHVTTCIRLSPCRTSCIHDSFKWLLLRNFAVKLVWSVQNSPICGACPVPVGGHARDEIPIPPSAPEFGEVSGIVVEV